jgi:hypothetical protein
VPLTSDRAAIASTLKEIDPEGNTAVLDGIYVSLMTTQAEPGRSLVIVCSDGRDTASWLEPDEVLESAKRSNAVIYAVAAGRARGWEALKSVTDATGGQTIEIESSKDLAGHFHRILDDFRSRYIVTFVPTGVAEGGFHRLDVRVKRGGVTVKARPGYIGKARRSLSRRSCGAAQADETRLDRARRLRRDRRRTGGPRARHHRDDRSGLRAMDRRRGSAHAGTHGSAVVPGDGTDLRAARGAERRDGVLPRRVERRASGSRNRSGQTPARTRAARSRRRFHAVPETRRGSAR